MSLWELCILAVGLSMDAFAIAICKGLSVEKVEKKHYLLAGAWFGGAQAVMPTLGYLLGSAFADMIESIDHWIAFILLVLIGIGMIRESREKVRNLDASFAPKAMFLLSVADSIDALAAGVSFSFLDVNIIPAAILIGCTTFAFSAAGIYIGSRFGAKYKSGAELVGGIMLILIGCTVLMEHLGVIQTSASLCPLSEELLVFLTKSGLI